MERIEDYSSKAKQPSGSARDTELRSIKFGINFLRSRFQARKRRLRWKLHTSYLLHPALQRSADDHRTRMVSRISGGADRPPDGSAFITPETRGDETQQAASSFIKGAVQSAMASSPQLRTAASKPIKSARKMAEEKLRGPAEFVKESVSRAGPALVTAMSLFYTTNGKGLPFATLYTLALLGSSCGFYLFLYFITVGYALGVTIPLSAALYTYNKHFDLSNLTKLHSALVVAWGTRLCTFLLWREFIGWPALHRKIQELRHRMSVPIASKILCWLVYSFFYVAVMSSCWSRLQGHQDSWGALGMTGIGMQSVGLVLETVADLQKSGFKRRHSHSWCNVGVWKWSTHANYLGEALFWWGTYLAHGFQSIPLSILCTIGIIFISAVLRGATRSLSRTHDEKYGDEIEYAVFRHTNSFVGPRYLWWWLTGGEDQSASIKSIYETSSYVTTESIPSVVLPEEEPPIM